MPNIESFQNRKHFLLLDGVRGIAILCVLWHHSAGAPPLDIEFFSRGYLGVDLFFILSGFLITHLLIKEKRTTGKISLANFYARRSLRIFPLYYGFIIFMLAWNALTAPEELRKMLAPLPYYVFYVTNWAPEGIYHFFHRAWSLAVEEQFYLLWPMTIVFLGIKLSSKIAAILVMALITLSLSFSTPELIENFIFNISWHLVPFRTILIGCLIAVALNHQLTFGLIAKYLSHALAAPAIGLLTLSFIFFQSGSIIGLDLIIIHILMGTFITACLVNERNYLSSFLSTKALQLTGRFSYGIYILHGLMWGPTSKVTKIIPIDAFSNSKFVFFILFTFGSFIISALSFYWFESFFLKQKSKFK